ncbi:MAG: acyltransferase [Nitrospira sp.]|nr:acyltransferase [Nitrospira sp.]
MNSHLSHPHYRPDIDGLRAFAVLSVVAFHASPGLLSGGFIGVDVFFVISGYLISTILFENLHNGTFNFVEFYSRRIRRIFPALLLTFTATYICGWFLLLNDEYQQLGKHIAGGAAFVSNFILWRESGYFDHASETKPLLHLWSLGIEEQFYILYPAILWLAWKRHVHLLSVTCLIAVISLSLNMSGVHSNATATFYSPLTRFWELMSGSVLAWATLYRSRWLPPLTDLLHTWVPARIRPDAKLLRRTTWNNMASLIGLSLLFYGVVRIGQDAPYPGAWALIPVLGSVLMIAAGPQAWMNKHVLSGRVAVWFGLISFPLYLWHWIILSFLRIMSNETPEAFVRIVAVMLSILLAWLTYRYVEQFVRRDAFQSLKVGILVLSMGVAFVVGLATRSMDGIPDRAVAQLNIALSSGFDGGDLGLTSPGCGILDPSTAQQFGICAQDSRGNVRFALMGDSKAAALYPGLVRTSQEHGRWLFIGGNGAQGAPVPMFSTTDSRRRYDEGLTHVAVQTLAENPDIEAVALVSGIRAIFLLQDHVRHGNFTTYDYTYLKHLRSSHYYGDTLEGIDAVVHRLVAAGKRVIFVIDNPALPDPKDCINRTTPFESLNRLLSGANDDCEVSLSEFTHQTALYRTLLEQLKDSYPDRVDIFDPTDIYCDRVRDLCSPRRDGRFLYSYTDHISDYAAGLVGVRLNALMNQQATPLSP